MDPKVQPPAKTDPAAGDERADALGEEIAFMEREIQSVDQRDRRRVALLHLEVVRLLESAGAKGSRVEERARKASEICPELAMTHQAYRRQLKRAKKWDEVIASLDVELKVTRDPESRAALHLERGRVLRDVLRKPEAAAADLDRAMTLVPGNAAGPEALRLLHARERSWAAVAHTLERAAGGSPSERALDLRREAAVLRDLALDQPGRAGPLYDMVLAEDPADPVAVAAAERLYAKSGRWLELCEVLTRRAEASENPHVRFDSYFRAATVAAERLSEKDRAAAWYEQAAKEHPDDPTPIDALADLHRRAGDWDALQKTLERRAALPASPSELSAIEARRAAVLADRMSRRMEAIALLEKALSADPVDPTLNHMLGSLLGAEGRVAERVGIEMLEAERIADPAARAAALYRIGESCEHDPEGMERAVAAFTRALEASPSSRAPFDALRRIWERTGEWKALSGLLDRRIEETGDESEKRMLLRRLAMLREERLGEPDGAVESLERLRSLDPSDTTTLWDLQKLHANAGRWQEHAAMLRAEAGLREDPAARADLLWRCGVVAEQRLDDPAAAMDAYEAAVEIAPAHRAALESLARIAEECGGWSDHLDYSDRAMQGLVPREQAQMLVRTARIAAEALGDEAQAVDRCRRALALDPGLRGALDLLRDLHERRGEWKELAGVMAQMAEAETDAHRRATLRSRLGDLLVEHLASHADAAEAYSSALSDVAGFGPALVGLERVHLSTGDWKGLAATLKQAARAATDDEARTAWLRKLAAVLAWRLDRPREAIAALREILASEAYDAPALRELSVLHLREEQWQEAADAIAELAASTADPDLAVAYIKEEISLRTTYLREDAAEQLRAALGTGPGDREILALVELRAPDAATLARALSARLEITDDPVDRAITMLRLAGVSREAGDEVWVSWLDKALQELPTFLPAVRQARLAAESRNDWPRVVELLEAEGTPEVSARAESRLEALRRAAGLATERLGDRARARETLARAFDLAPGDVAVASELGAMLREENLWRELTEVLGRHAAAIDAPRQPAVLFDLACVLRDQLQSPNEAGRTLEKILQIDKRHSGALVALGDIHFGAASWQKAIGAYRSAEDAIERHSPLWRHARLRRVEVLTERLGLFPDGEALVKDALSDRAEDRELLAVLARVLRGARNWAGVEAVLDRLIRSALPAEAAGLWVERGRMALAQRDRERVCDCLKQAAELSLQAPEAFASVRSFACEITPEDGSHVLKEVLYHAPPTRQSTTGPLRLLAAQLISRQGKDAAAESEVRLALELVPEDVGGWILLSQTSSNGTEVRRALEQALGLDPFQPEIYQGLMKLGEENNRLEDLRLRAAQLLTAFGSYSAGVKPHQPPQGDRRLSRSQVVAWVVHPSEPRRAMELLAQAGTKLATLYHQPDYGMLEPLPQTNEVGRQVDVVARLFGVDRYDVFYTKQSSVLVSLWLDERPRVIVGPQAASAPQPFLRFHLGRVFVLIASGSAMAGLVPGEEVRKLVEALAGQQIVNIGEPEQVQRVGKALGWMARRGIAQAAREYASSPENMSGWQAATVLTANRGGLLACADIAAARAALHAMAGVPLPAPGAPDTWDVSRSVPGLGDLLAWAVSDEYASARSQIA